MYAYYKKIADTEHYLLQKEIAAISGFVSTENRPHTQLIGAAIKEYVSKYNIEQTYYYSTIYGKMLSVFSKKVYQPILEELYSQIANNARGNIKIGSKSYSYVLTHRMSLGGAA